jgi:TrmH family RNA methyltransferase
MDALSSRTRVVLHHPFFPENIGAVARAMKNTGLADLRVVGGASPSHERAVALARRAGDLLDDSQVHAELEGALAGATLVIATTSHLPEGLRPWTPRAAAVAARAHQGPVALVFGNEKNGLAHRDVRCADIVVRIPCVVADSSLNLAQAAMILCYEWMLADQVDGPPDPCYGWPAAAADADVAALAGQVEAALLAMGFFKPPAGEKRRATIRQVLARLALDPGEVAALRSAARRWRRGVGPQDPGSSEGEGGLAGS